MQVEGVQRAYLQHRQQIQQLAIKILALRRINHQLHPLNLSQLLNRIQKNNERLLGFKIEILKLNTEQIIELRDDLRHIFHIVILKDNVLDLLRARDREHEVLLQFLLVLSADYREINPAWRG